MATDVNVVEDDDARTVLARVDELFASADPADLVGFLGRQYDLGLARVHYPIGEGGLGFRPKLQALVVQTIAERGGPAHPYNVGPGMVGPTIVAWASAEIKARYLRPLYSAHECWCQLFSEPGAGSDVANLSTRAVRDGDEWTVNGQKVWTSLAHIANFGLLLARTDPDVPKHKGITAFLVDMHQPGVEVRPLRQINGTAEFNEVYFTDARVPDSHRLGGVGDGWRVAVTTLMNERVHIGGGEPKRGEGVIEPALEAWARRPGNAVQRDELMRLFVEAEVHRLSNIRAAQLRTRGTPGPEGGIGKLVSALLQQRVLSFATRLIGPEGTLYPGYDTVGRSDRDLRVQFLGAQSTTIAGGTSEIMRNIIGERTLGLPGEPRVDRDAAWNKLPH